MSEVSLVDGHIDNTITEEDIIKAVAKCASIGESCEGCPFYDYTDCDKRLKEKFHSLINRKNAEIEEWKLEQCRILHRCSEQIIEARDEAIKEFAERLKCNASILCDRVTGLPCSYTISNYDFNRLVKEMTESK